MPRELIIGLTVACLVAVVSTQASAETRLALVIGNSAYAHTTPLTNPRNDAELIAATLTQAGFSVTTVLDADQGTMKRALVDFGRVLRSSNAVGLFYYAGHGVQMKGENYLIPIDANITDEAEIPIAAVNVNEFLVTMETLHRPLVGVKDSGDAKAGLRERGSNQLCVVARISKRRCMSIRAVASWAWRGLEAVLGN